MQATDWKQPEKMYTFTNRHTLEDAIRDGGRKDGLPIKIERYPYGKYSNDETKNAMQEELAKLKSNLGRRPYTYNPIPSSRFSTNGYNNYSLEQSPNRPVSSELSVNGKPTE